MENLPSEKYMWFLFDARSIEMCAIDFIPRLYVISFIGRRDQYDDFH